jgi:hypothetical protein
VQDVGENVYHVACDDKTEEHLSHHEIHLHFNKGYPAPAEKIE